MHGTTLIDFDICLIAKIVLHDLDLLLKVQKNGTLKSSASCRKNEWFYRFSYLPSKDNITKILFHELDLFFEGQKF